MQRQETRSPVLQAGQLPREEVRQREAGLTVEIEVPTDRRVIDCRRSSTRQFPPSRSRGPRAPS